MSKADKLGVGASFGNAPRISARRAAIAAATDAPTEGVIKQEFRLDVISFNPDNPRESLNGIQEMANTLEAVGQITAITIATVSAYLKQRPERERDLKPGAQYVIVDGHRRLAGAEALKWDTIRAIVDDAQVATDERLLEAAFIANTQRDDMTELEQAEALRKLVAFHGSQHKAAKRLGMSQAVVSQRLSLLSLSPDLQAELNSGVRKVEHVRGLAGFSPDDQRAKADQRAAAAKRRGAKKPPANVEPPAVAPSVGESDNAVITSDATAAGAPDQTKVVPPQSTHPAAETKVAETRWQEPPTWPEPEWAAGDTSEPVNAARDLVDRYTHEQRQTIVSYLLSVGDAEQSRERASRERK